MHKHYSKFMLIFCLYTESRILEDNVNIIALGFIQKLCSNVTELLTRTQRIRKRTLMFISPLHGLWQAFCISHKKRYA
jgi:hypothetical protein